MLRLLIFFFSFLPLTSTLQAGLLIEVSGIDGSGKSTFIEALSRSLREQGKSVSTLSPLRGDTSVYPFLDKVDALKNNSSNPSVKARIENFKSGFFLLSFLDQKNTIESLLKENDFVICDRYLFSFKTYQECFNQTEDSKEEILQDMPQAGLTIMLTVPMDLALQRLGERKKADSYENRSFLENAQTTLIRNASTQSNLLQLNGEEEWPQKVEKTITFLKGFHGL